MGWGEKQHGRTKRRRTVGLYQHVARVGLHRLGNDRARGWLEKNCATADPNLS